jgi:hypothetical protein
MRFMTSWMGLIAVGVLGCGSVVTVFEGGGGQGGDTPVPPNPPQCPATAPQSYDTCGQPDASCTYTEEAGCSVTYVCVVEQNCYDGGGVGGGWDGTGGDAGSYGTTSGGGFGAGGYGSGGYYDDDGGYGAYGGYGYGGYGYGGYAGGGCEEYAVWIPTSASCPNAVDCEVASDGDICALPGDYCGLGDECSYTDKWCGDDHRWTVSYWEDDCCFDECYCDPYYCPSTPPATGDYCDPCYDAEGCFYETASPCGPLTTHASCGPDYSWAVEQEACDTPQPGE